MVRSITAVLALVALGVLLDVSAHVGDDKDNSPEAVFKACTTALKEQDVKTAMSHLTRDSQSAVAGAMWDFARTEKAHAGSVSGKPTPEEKKQIEAFDAVLNRHQLSDDAFRKIMEEHQARRKKENKDGRDEVGMLVLAGEMVKDKPALVADLMKSAPAGVDSLFKMFGDAKVKDVMIDGQQAKGLFTFQSATGEQKATIPVVFTMEDGVWKIDVIETVRNQQAPPPAPQAQPPAVRYEPPPRLLRRLCSCLRWR